MKLFVRDKKDIKDLIDHVNYLNCNGKNFDIELEWVDKKHNNLVDKIRHLTPEYIDADVETAVLQKLGFDGAPENSNDIFHYMYIASENIILWLKGTSHEIEVTFKEC